LYEWLARFKLCGEDKNHISETGSVCGGSSEAVRRNYNLKIQQQEQRKKNRILKGQGREFVKGSGGV
jgi:hypothetical protein